MEWEVLHASPAHALADSAKISEVYRRGELSPSKPCAVTRIATPATEGNLLRIGRKGTVAQLEHLLRFPRRIDRLEANADAEVQPQRREVSWFYDEDDCLVIKVRLPADSGDLIVKALEALAQSYLVTDSGRSSGGDRYTVHRLTSLETPRARSR